MSPLDWAVIGMFPAVALGVVLALVELNRFDD